MPFIFWLFFYKKNASKDIKVFFVYTLLLFMSILVLLVCRYVIKSYTIYIFFDRVYLLAEFALVSRFFFYVMSQPRLKKITQFLIIPFICFSTYDYIISDNNHLPYNPLVLECFLFTFIIVLFFYEKMIYSTKAPIYTSHSFWIAIAFLIFSTGNFFLFLFSNLLLENGQNSTLYLIVYGSFTILKNIFLCIAISVASRNSQVSKEYDDLDINLPFENFTSVNKYDNTST